MNENLIVIFGISFIFFMTCLGSLTVLFNKKQNDLAQNLFLGFAGGVIVAVATLICMARFRVGDKAESAS